MKQRCLDEEAAAIMVGRRAARASWKNEAFIVEFLFDGW